MKYKVLKSIAHNFAHSFVSGMNYVDNGHVFDDLRQLARNAKGERVTIQWVPDSPPDQHLPSRIQKSIGYYKEGLPQFVAREGGSLETIRDLRPMSFLKLIGVPLSKPILSTIAARTTSTLSCSNVSAALRSFQQRRDNAPRQRLY